MNIIEDTYPQALPPTVATIGFFDGVHLGHRYLINQVKIAASQCGWCSSIITFPVHPRQVIQSDYQPQLLSSPEEKIELLSQTGVDNCILLPFTPELSRLTAYEFMQLLYDKYKVRMLVIGYDHRFATTVLRLSKTIADMDANWVSTSCKPWLTPKNRTR